MSEYNLAPELLESIKTFVTVLKEHPGILENESLGFFRDYLQSLGAKIPKVSPSSKPKPTTGSGDTPTHKPKPTGGVGVDEVDLEEDEPEPMPEIDQEGIITADDPDPSQDMGDLDASVSDENMDKSNELKGEAIAAFGEGNFQESVAKYTEAIKLNGGSAILFAKRGQAYLKLQKPNACIRDCSHALQINPDSAVAFKFRGRAYRLLGKWEDAAKDLRQACKIDCDETANEWLQEVQPNARKLEEWRLRQKRKDEERDIKLRRLRAQERARAHQEAKSTTAGPDIEMDDGPGGGASPFGAGIPGLDKLMSDPEVVELFSDPEVAAAFNDIGSNPMNILKYQSNPKVAKLLSLLQKKLGGGGGMGMPGMGMPGGMGGFPGGMGGFPGGMGGFPGGMGGGPPPSQPQPPSGDDLD